MTVRIEQTHELRKTILSRAMLGTLVKWSNPKPFSIESILAEASSNGVSVGPSKDTSATEILRISAGTSRADHYVNEEDFKHVELSAGEIEKHRLLPGDLLARRFNGNLNFVGRFSQDRGASQRVQVNPDKLIRFRVDTRQHCPRFVCYAMNAAHTRKTIEAMCATTAGNIGISAGKLKTVEISLPSIDEQERTVDKVDELLLLCDRLECQIESGRDAGSKLLEAVIAEALAPS